MPFLIFTGEYIITANYLKHPQDLQDAVRGIADIIRVVNDDEYMKAFQPAGLDSCPMQILNGLINLLDETVMSWQDIGGLSSSNGEHSGVNEVREKKRFFGFDKSSFDFRLRELRRYFLFYGFFCSVIKCKFCRRAIIQSCVVALLLLLFRFISCCSLFLRIAP